MKLLRRIHLFLGVFFAPLLLFFVGTGWYQTFDAARIKSPGEAETLVQKLRVVHTDHIYPFENVNPKGASPKLFKWLVGGMSAALSLTTLVGVFLAFRAVRQSWTIWAALGIGLMVPAVLLWLGQRR